MQFFIHCNFFCQEYKLTYLLITMSGFKLNIEIVLQILKAIREYPPWLGATSGNLGNLTPLDALKLHSLCSFQNINMCLAKRNMHLFVIKNSNHLFIQQITFYSQKDIFKYFQEYYFRK